MVFALFQLGDNQKEAAAYHFYARSGLANIELAYYSAYLKGHRQLPIPLKPKAPLKTVGARRGYARLKRMLQDQAFQNLLRQQRIVEKTDGLFKTWRHLRTEFETRLNRSIAYRFGLKPNNPKWYTFFTCMFLHGGVGHLLGNMIFLWLVGCFLEMGCGRTYYTLLYLLTGVAASIVFALVYPDSPGPLVGASGAIAGMMGAFAVLFGKRRVKIFFSLGFYFGYRQVPAMLLLPLWLGNECYQLFFTGASHVAYVAHIGGISTGAALGFLNLKKIGAYDVKAIEPEPEDEISPMIESALEHLSRLEMAEGRQILEAALVKDPGNTTVMTHLFRAFRHEPENPRFHSLTGSLLGQLTRKSATHGEAIGVHGDYLRAAGRSKLGVDTLIRMSSVYATQGRPQEAEPLLAAALKRKPDDAAIPPALMRLAKGYQETGENAKFIKCLRILVAKYPDSYEAQHARRAVITASLPGAPVASQDG
jgi:membrane associated rhomboid family serine protease